MVKQYSVKIEACSLWELRAVSVSLMVGTWTMLYAMHKYRGAALVQLAVGLATSMCVLSYGRLFLLRWIHNLRSVVFEKPHDHSWQGSMPFISVIIPAQNEANVISDLLDSFGCIEYPKDKFEVIVVDDGSSDQTTQIVQQYVDRSRKHSRTTLTKYKLVRKVKCGHGGKSGCINAGWSSIDSRADIIGYIDADSVAHSDLLNCVARAIPPLKVNVQNDDPPIVAGQIIRSILPDRCASYIAICQLWEMAAHGEILRSRSLANHYGELQGNGQFVLRCVLEEHMGAACAWNESTVTDDLDMTVRLVGKGFRVTMIDRQQVTDESESLLLDHPCLNWSEVYSQRKRWMLGSYQRFLDYWRPLLSATLHRPNWTVLDMWFFCWNENLVPIGLAADAFFAMWFNTSVVLSPIMHVCGVLILSHMLFAYKRLHSSVRRNWKVPIFSVVVAFFFISAVVVIAVYVAHVAPFIARKQAYEKATRLEVNATSEKKKRGEWIASHHILFIFMAFLAFQFFYTMANYWLR